MRTICVTGEVGYGGSHCRKAFAERGWRVVVCDSLSRGWRVTRSDIDEIVRTALRRRAQEG